MTGLRQEIAKHVVLNILDTLNENDFVNIFTFSETTQELVPCFNDTLVQVTVTETTQELVPCFNDTLVQVTVTETRKSWCLASTTRWCR